MLASLALYSTVSGRDALAEGVGTASEAIAESLARSMDMLLYLKGHELMTVIGESMVVNAVAASNVEFDAMADAEAYIDQVDDEWTSTPLDVVPDSMVEILGSSISEMLRRTLIEHYLTEHGFEIFANVVITNKYGAVMAVTARVDDFRQNDETWWHSAQETELLITDVQRDIGTGIYGPWICVPVLDVSGEVIGVAMAVTNVLLIAKDIELTALGYETSELKITTPDGRLIFSSRAYVMLQNVSSTAFFTHVEGERGHFIEKEGEDNRLFSYVTSLGYREYEGHGWMVFLSHSEREVLGPATTLQTRILTVAVLAILLGGLISVAISRSITRPISDLEAAARGMARGELNRRLSTARRDEFGRLAKSFNEMAGDLEKMYTGLDKLVKERTKDLEKVNEKLKVLSSITRHDALNQVSIQKGWLGMAIELSKDPEVNEYLSKVEMTTDTLASFIQFTSEYEEVGAQKPQWQSLDEALVTATAGLDLGGVGLKASTGGVEILADPMFPKVIHNIVNNSLKHGKKLTSISLSCSEGPGLLTIVIEDDGRGVPAEEKELIFKREHPSGRKSHGMFLAAEILWMTGMAIRENGVEGEGARFEITVPEGNYRRDGGGGEA